MQWPYEISADQWAALGAMLGGVAQVGLVMVGWYAGRQWFQQKRVEGLHALVLECMQLMHDMEVAADRSQVPVSRGGERDKQFEIINQGYVQLMGVATRCAYYDEQLSEFIRAYALRVFDLLQAYGEYSRVPQRLMEGDISPEERQQSHTERLAVINKLFRTAWYTQFLNHKQDIIARARFVSWGRERL